MPDMNDRRDLQAAPKHADDRVHDPRRPWTNTRPPANPERNREDCDRSVERMSALVGR